MDSSDGVLGGRSGDVLCGILRARATAPCALLRAAQKPTSRYR